MVILLELASILKFLRQLLSVSRSVILIQKRFESEASFALKLGALTLASPSPKGDTNASNASRPQPGSFLLLRNSLGPHSMLAQIGSKSSEVPMK